MTETTKKRATWVTFSLAALLVAVLAFGVLTPLLSWNGVAYAQGDEDVKPTPTPTATPTSTPMPTPTATCETQFKQVELSHEGNRVDDKNKAKYEAAIKDASNLSDAQREFFISEAGTSAWKLAIWSHAVGLHEDPNDWTDLVTEDGACLNEAGKELWYTTKGAVTAKGVTFSEAQAPENGWNSGIHGTQYGTSDTQGVRGDRTAIKITFADGTVAYILIRCGNPVYPGKPGLPDVPTDNPPKPTPEPKNPKEDVLVNPKVPDQLKDGGEKHTVSKEDGSKVANGYQADPKGDAKKAEKKAKEEAAKAEEEHKEAVEEAVVVEEDQEIDQSSGGPTPTPTPLPPPQW